MSAALDNAARLGVLAVPAALAVLMCAVGRFDAPDRAIGAFNTYAVYVGFPALVASGVLAAGDSVPSDVLFWLIVPVLDLVLVGVTLVLGRWLPPRQTGSLALVMLFGNFAYLGLPMVDAVFDGSANTQASLLVAIHVAIAVGVGPWLLVRWSGTEGGVAGAGWRLLAQPLVWAPVVGLVVRRIGGDLRVGVAEVIDPIAASAAPIALFALGLHIWSRRDLLVRAAPGEWLHVVARLSVAPLVAAGVGWLAVRSGELGEESGRVLVVLAAMPAAITTFSLGHEHGVAEDRLAGVVARSSVCSLLTIPIVATMATW